MNDYVIVDTLSLERRISRCLSTIRIVFTPAVDDSCVVSISIDEESIEPFLHCSLAFT
jgi:hypothetical protein